MPTMVNYWWIMASDDIKQYQFRVITVFLFRNFKWLTRQHLTWPRWAPFWIRFLVWWLSFLGFNCVYCHAWRKMALKKVKGTLERVLDKNMQDLVRGIRNHKETEVGNKIKSLSSWCLSINSIVTLIRL